eukprot:598115-Hanusia_phi.AAC.1
MAKSLFEAKDKFVESVVKMYPQLKNSRAELEFGYRVRIPGLEEKMKAEGREDELKVSGRRRRKRRRRRRRREGEGS